MGGVWPIRAYTRGKNQVVVEEGKKKVVVGDRERGSEIKQNSVDCM